MEKCVSHNWIFDRPPLEGPDPISGSKTPWKSHILDNSTEVSYTRHLLPRTEEIERKPQDSVRDAARVAFAHNSQHIKALECESFAV